MIEDYINLVGPAGIALVVLAVFSVYLSLRNGIYLFLVDRDFKRKFRNIENGHDDYAQYICQNTDNPLVGIIAGIVQTHALHSNDLRSEVAYMFHRNFESITRGLTYLRLISVIAPLLGLLGTMFGMVSVFRHLAVSSGAESTVLAAGIWEALLTTIMGLSVAIPTLVIYYYLSLTLKGFRIEAIEHSYRAVELMGVSCSAPTDQAEPKLQAESPAVGSFPKNSRKLVRRAS